MSRIIAEEFVDELPSGRAVTKITKFLQKHNIHQDDIIHIGHTKYAISGEDYNTGKKWSENLTNILLVYKTEDEQ